MRKHVPKTLKLIPLLFFLTFKVFSQHPVLNSFTPEAGPTGSVVEILGSGFDPISSNNIVYFGACRAIVQSSTANSLIAICPIGASYDNISVTTGGKIGFSSKPFIVTFQAGNEITPANMAPPFGVFTGSGSYPRHHVSCDFDGDNKPDIAIVFTNTSYLSVYRNTISSPTNITFAGPSTFTLPASNAMYIAKGDIDCDSKPDLIVSNYSHNSISVFRNTSTPGNISFTDAGAFNSAQNPLGLAISDYDADGKPDIAVINNNSNTVSIFRNTSIPGTISLEARINFTVGTWPQAVGAADLDGDGKTDIAVTNYNGANISVLRNTGNPGLISFTPKTDYPTGTNPVFIIMGDLDADNKPDICLSNGGSQTVSIFRNTSSPGNISLASRIDITTGNIPNGIALSDLDGDGKVDLAVNNFAGGSFSILKNSSIPGAMSFAPNVNIPVAGNTNRSLAITDLDGDGKGDVTITKSTADVFSVYQNLAGTYDIKSVCIGGTTTLTSETASSSYLWEVRENGFWGTVYNGGNYSGANTATLTISNISVSNNYQEYRCMIDGNIRTKVQVLKTFTSLAPLANIQATGGNNICPGSAVTITSTIQHGGNSPVYQWKVNGANAGSNSPSFSRSGLNHGDQVQLELTSNLSCAMPASVSSNTISFSHSLSIPVISSVANSISVANTDPAATYSWEIQDAGSNWIPLVPAATGTSVNVTVTGNYRVKAIKGSCTVYSNIINLVVTAVTNPNYVNNTIRLSPIPVTNELWVDSLKLADKWETLDVITINGSTSIKQVNVKGITTVRINTAAIPKGVYVLILRRADGKFTSAKFVKM